VAETAQAVRSAQEALPDPQRETSAAASNQGTLEDQLLLEFRAQVLSDPLFLPHKVLGYGKLTDLNIDWLSWALNTRRGLFLGPPQHFKSTTLSVVLPLLMLLIDPECCGFIGSKTLPKAEDFARAIRNSIREIPALRAILHDPHAQDSNEGFTVRRHSRRHDPSIKTVAPGASLVKSHADWAILDDLVDQEDQRSQAAREATIQWFLQSFLRAMTKGAKIIIVGQRWHEDDLYGVVERRARDLGFEVYIAQALRKGKALDPSILNVEELTAKRIELGTPLFELQWNQNSSALEGDFFKWNQFQIYHEPPPRDEFDVYQGIDLAISEREKAHYTVIATMGHHRKSGHDYLLHIRRGRWQFGKQLEVAEAEAQEWQPIKRRAEAQAYQKAFVETARSSVHPIEGSTAKTDKVSHARPWQARVEAGKFWVPDPERVDWAREFLKECCAFQVKPGKGYDDQVDAVSYAEDLIREAMRPSEAETVNPGGAGRGAIDRIRGGQMAAWRRGLGQGGGSSLGGLGQGITGRRRR